MNEVLFGKRAILTRTRPEDAPHLVMWWADPAYQNPPRKVPFGEGERYYQEWIQSGRLVHYILRDPAGQPVGALWYDPETRRIQTLAPKHQAALVQDGLTAFKRALEQDGREVVE